MAPVTRARPSSTIPKSPVTLSTCTDRVNKQPTNPPSPSPLDEDFQDATEYAINNKEDVIAFLTQHLICILKHLMDLQNIATSLHHINQLPNISLVTRKAIRAVAFILEDYVASEIATSITSHIVTPITKQITAQVIKAMQPHMGELLHTSKALTHSTSTLQIHLTSLTTTVNTLNNQADRHPHFTTRKTLLHLMMKYESYTLSSIITDITLPAVKTCLRILTTAQHEALTAYELTQ
jgi:hypothetical protein